MRGKFQAVRIHEKPVGRLEATLTNRFESWNLQFVNDLVTQRAAAAKPEWCPIEWQDLENEQLSPQTTERLMLSKMQLFFDFAVGPPQDGEADVLAQLKNVFGDVISMPIVAKNSTPIRVEAELWANGTVSGRMDYSRASSPLGQTSLEMTELFARQQMRLELRKRISALK